MIRHPSQNLTDNYRKDEESCNYKLLSLGHGEHLEIYEALKKIEASRDIDLASGFTLDKAGKNVLELRGGRSDEVFRQAINIKLLKNLSAGTINELNDICGILFGEDFDGLEEAWYIPEFDFEPAALILSVKENPDRQMIFLDSVRELSKAARAGGIGLYHRQIAKKMDKELYVGVALSETARISISMKPLSSFSVSASLYTGTALSEISAIKIPPKVLHDTKISTTAFFGTAMFEYSRITIPTAAIREGN